MDLDEAREGFGEPRCPVLVEATFRSPSCGSLKAAVTRDGGSLKTYVFALKPSVFDTKIGLLRMIISDFDRSHPKK